jgi:predicted CoA-binding protein
MTTFKTKAQDFLAQERIAVVGVSRTQKETANFIYRRLRSDGYKVFPVNPNADTVEGDTCYPNLKALPSKVDGVIIVTRADMAVQVVRECAEVGVTRVWMHRNGFLGAAASSVSEEAVAFCQNNGITAIAGGCPLMFSEFSHKCMRWVLGALKRLPD